VPWTSKDANKNTKKADTKAEKKQWATVANKVLKSTGNDAKAIRIANSSIKKKAK
jgi:hypothetical protein